MWNLFNGVARSSGTDLSDARPSTIAIGNNRSRAKGVLRGAAWVVCVRARVSWVASGGASTSLAYVRGCTSVQVGHLVDGRSSRGGSHLSDARAGTISVENSGTCAVDGIADRCRSDGGWGWGHVRGRWNNRSRCWSDSGGSRCNVRSNSRCGWSHVWWEGRGCRCGNHVAKLVSVAVDRGTSRRCAGLRLISYRSSAQVGNLIKSA